MSKDFQQSNEGYWYVDFDLYVSILSKPTSSLKKENVY